MNKKQMTEVLGIITERVYGDNSVVTLKGSWGTSPVKLQIGFINNVVFHDGIVITDAPPAVMDVIMDWVNENGSGDDGPPVMASPGYGGLFIR